LNNPFSSIIIQQCNLGKPPAVFVIGRYSLFQRL
jgi:hypothetical protein